jgi:cytochrome c biogenesis protein CcmG/thiol:disulfide interchange protein DsbE
MKEKLFGGLVTFAVLAVLYVFAMPSYRQGEPSIAGRRAPDFALEMNGRQMHLSDFRGKVVLLDFWASWCQPCVEETPSLNRLQQRIEAAGGIVLGISQDDDAAAYERFLKEQHVVFPTYRDTSKKTAANYGTAMFPEAYLISRDGRIARKIVGPQAWESAELSSALDTLLRAN